MLHSLLLLCTVHALIASAMLWPGTVSSAVTQALSPTGRGPRNISAPFSNSTVFSSHSSNITGQKPGNGSNTSSEQALPPFLDPYKNFSDQCLLWDDECIGNKTDALELFFNNSGTLYHMVEDAHCIWSRVPKCAPWLPSPAVLPELLDWLRKPECVQSFYEYHTQHEDQPTWTWSRRAFNGWNVHTIDWNTIATTTSNVGCCRQCTIVGGNVDVYYWPALGANSDCVSTIGSNFKDPSTELVVYDNRGYPYWKAQKNPWGQNDSQSLDSVTAPPEQAFPGGDANPLSAPTYIIQARKYWQGNITHAANISSSKAIATIGNFRCTSPSICVGFSDIYAADECGALSTDGEVIPYTLVAFAPGELSTVQVPAWVRDSVPPKAAIRSFNFADLPCPPQSIMYDVEYKPAPGEPYRPVLLAPHRLSSLLPGWSKSGCVIPAALFNGVDPPRALKPAEILTPRVTQALPSASVVGVPAPASGIRSNEPSRTPSPSATGDDTEASTLADSETRESGSDVSDPSSSDPQRTSLQDAGPKASDSENPDINQSKSNSVDPQGVRPSILSPGKGTVDVDSKHATLQPSYSQDVNSQLADVHEMPKEVQDSNLDISASDDSKADTDDSKADSSNPDHSQPKVPDDPSNTADLSSKKSKNPPSHDENSQPSNTDGKDTANSSSQEAEVADSNLDVSKPGDSKADSSNPDRSQPKVSDDPSNTADLSSEKSKNPPSHDDESHSSNTDGKDTANSSSQEAEVADSNLDVSKSGDVKADSSNPDRSQLKVPDDYTADLGSEKSETPPSHEDNPRPANSNGETPSKSNSHEAEAADPDTHDLDILDNETKIINSKGKDGAVFHSNKSPAADPEANVDDESNTSGTDDNLNPFHVPPTNTINVHEALYPSAIADDKSNIKGTDDELDLFHILPTNPFNIHKALNPDAKHSEGQHSTPKDPEHDPSSQPEDSRDPLPENARHSQNRPATEPLSLSDSSRVLPTADPDPLADVFRETAISDDSTLSHQQLTNHLPTAESVARANSLMSKTATAGDPASETIAITSSKTLESSSLSANVVASAISSSSASVAASVALLGSNELSDNESPGGESVPSATPTDKTKSSASRLLGSGRRHLEGSFFTSGQGLWYSGFVSLFLGLLLMI